MTSPVLPSSGVLTPLGLNEVQLTSGFWAHRRALSAQVTLPHCAERMTTLGWIDNFRDGGHRGPDFADSEVHKLLEAASWHGDDALVERITPLLARAQHDDGYLNTRWSGRRYQNLEWGHELYCAGHLIQASVARARRHGDDLLVEVGRRAADHVCARFLEGDQVCGHPEIEMALVELCRLTGEERYLEMARRFVERRGRPALGDSEHGRAYFQDDQPVRTAPAFRGHAVRQLYLACGAVDVAVETGDTALLAAVEAQWERTVARRTYLTGGMGSRHRDEAFGEDFELPPDRAYAETCAGIASVMLCWRLLLATGHPRYAELAERTLYNVVATSLASDGRSFFYVNPLQVRTPGVPAGADEVSWWGGSALRAPWFSTSCCPPNIARTLGALPGYLATRDRRGVQLHQFASAEIDTRLVDGSRLRLSVRTDYPESGTVLVRVVDAPRETCRVSLRVPVWADGASVFHPEGVVRAAPGLATVDRRWRPGDELRLELPMTPRWSWPDRRIDAVRDCVAVERGPLVYCAESPGDEPPLAEISVDTSVDPVEHARGGVVELSVAGHRTSPAAESWPYGGSPAPRSVRPHRVRLVPYHQWGNRGPVSMRVWLPRSGPLD
ncbi:MULTISPECIES: beta-L-arabinofuranosidase domain-containing protein [Actinoalloteichus]